MLTAYPFNLKKIGLAQIGGYENIGANIEVEDRKGHTYKTHASTSVQFIKREERVIGAIALESDQIDGFQEEGTALIMRLADHGFDHPQHCRIILAKQVCQRV